MMHGQKNIKLCEYWSHNFFGIVQIHGRREGSLSAVRQTDRKIRQIDG